MTHRQDIQSADDNRSFDLGESRSLITALVFRFAARHGLRGLALKGIGLDYHGLRATHIPGDLDVLVEADRTPALEEGLSLAGWSGRVRANLDSRRSRYSITMLNPGWPVDIDLHHEFPGLLAGPERAFEVLWEHREQMMVAGFPCWIPDRASSIVIWALHSLRGTHTQPRHAEELAQLVNDVLPKLSEAERLELADRIVELGADEPLRVVPECAEIIGDRRGPRAPGALEAWLGKVAQAHEVTPWLQVLREARPAERPGLLLRAIWPSSHDLRLSDEFLVDTPFGRVQSRGRRAWRLVRRFVERRRQAR